MSTQFKGESFFLTKGKRAVLLLHGFTASTQEVEDLGFKLAEAGFTVLAPLLAGHNSSFTEFSSTSSNDYYKSVELMYEKLVNDYESVDIVGLSFGATLALHLAVNKKIRRIVTLAPAIFYQDPLTNLAHLLQFLYKGKVMKKNKLNKETGVTSRWDLYKPSAVEERLAYSWLAFPQLQSTRKFMHQVRGELSQITQPILIIHSKKDATTKPSGAQYIFDHISSQEKELIWLERSGHVITEDYEAKLVSDSVIKFLTV